MKFRVKRKDHVAIIEAKTAKKAWKKYLKAWGLPSKCFCEVRMVGDFTLHFEKTPFSIKKELEDCKEIPVEDYVQRIMDLVEVCDENDVKVTHITTENLPFTDTIDLVNFWLNNR